MTAIPAFGLNRFNYTSPRRLPLMPDALKAWAGIMPLSPRHLYGARTRMCIWRLQRCRPSALGLAR